MVLATGEFSEYINAEKYQDGRKNDTPSEWYDRLKAWVTQWVKEQKHGTQQ
jgi:hypothetical protein